MIRGAEYPRQARDTYITPAEPIEALFNAVKFAPRLCDPCCGNGAMLRVFEKHGHIAFGFDIAPWGDYPIRNFLTVTIPWETNFDIVTNPPYGPQGVLALAFIERALEVTRPWKGKVAMLLSIDFDSGKTRRHVFADHTAWCQKIVLLDRIKWFNGEAGSSNHAWYVWDWKYSDCNLFPIIRYR